MMATRRSTGLWAALILVVLIIGVLVFAQTRPDRHDDIGDAWITTQVQASYFADADVRGRNVEAVTRDGVVTLTGEVATEHERDRAVALAREIQGVHRVVDNLRVRPEAVTEPLREQPPDMAREAPPPQDPPREDVRLDEPREVEPDDDRPLRERIDDGWITTKVQSQYFLDMDIRGRHIDVTTEDGIVTLSGEVETQAERDQAVRIARETDGVRDVEDRLRIVRDDPEIARDEPRDPTVPADDRDLTERIDDGWITTQIQAQFFLDTDIKGRDIEVTTEDGVVTLSGEVQSEAERQRALAIVRDIDGVRQVDDQLTVRTTL